MVTIKMLAEHAEWFGGWAGRHRVWLAGWLLVTAGAVALGTVGVAVGLGAVALGPALAATLWHALAPDGYERWAAGPWRRAGWRLMITRGWDEACRDCNLSDRRTVTKTGTDGKKRSVEKWRHPRLRRLRASANSVTLTVRCRRGQTLTELESGVERLAALWDTHAFRCWPDQKNPASTLVIELVMRDVLTEPVVAVAPEEPRAVVDQVRLGRTQAGNDWLLRILGRHTLCVGASGSGKGSVLWGICNGLAPAVHTDLVRLWGIDLKRGIELAIGEPLFSARAYTPEQAVGVLRALLAVIDERGGQMVGNTRLHVPVIGDPLHVLVIDELAVLTAYGPPDIRREAERLLAEILTQGRALGVVVVAFVQDPRKDVVDVRDLFTQTIALRLKTSDQTEMVLGDGMRHLAPAHRIDPTRQGTGWIVTDSGAVDRVRADFSSDDLIRLMAARYPTTEHHDTPEAVTRSGLASVSPLDLLDPHVLAETKTSTATGRKPRKPRKPRQTGTEEGTEDGPEESAS